MKNWMKVLMTGLMVLLVVGLTGCSKGNSEDDRANEDIKWQFISAEDMKEKLESEDNDYQIIDIQPEKDFAKGHLEGSISIPAYPVDTEELEKLVVDQASDFEGETPIYVVCPGGGSGAKRTISILKEKGIDESRMFILEKGAKGWPYDELWVKD